jgi:competence protein ComEA
MPSPLLSSLLARVLLAPRRRVLVALAVPPALLTAVLVGLLVYGAPSGPSARPPASPAGAGGAEGVGAGSSLPAPAGLLVDVSGAVAHPGVYRVAKGERASAAIAAAGGLTPDADPDRLPNLAARLQDGAQVKVPSLTPAARSSTGTAVRAAAVSLNTATSEQLAAVPGFTPELAAAVIEYRTEYGGFASTRELVDVLLMSEADYQLARRYVTI